MHKHTDIYTLGACELSMFYWSGLPLPTAIWKWKRTSTVLRPGWKIVKRWLVRIRSPEHLVLSWAGRQGRGALWIHWTPCPCHHWCHKPRRGRWSPPRWMRLPASRSSALALHGLFYHSNPHLFRPSNHKAVSRKEVHRDGPFWACSRWKNKTSISPLELFTN